MTPQDRESPNRSTPFRFSLAPTVQVDGRPHLESLGPFVRYLEGALARPVQVVSEGGYAETLGALREGRLDAAMLGEIASHQAELGGGVEPLVAPASAGGEAPTYESVIFTRLDTGIHDLGGLRGATVGLVDEQSTSGYLVPRAMLREAGLDPDTDVNLRLFGQHRAVIEAVIAGEVVAGGIHAGRLKPPSLDRGPDYARLRVLATSQPIPLGPLVVRADLDPATRAALTTAMLRVHEADPAAAYLLLRAGLRFTLAMRRATPTLKSIAALAGVSYATVSRVVNGAGYVAPETAARVQAIVRELGYRPNGNALTLQGQRAPLVGLIVPRRSTDMSPLLADLWERLSTDLAAAGVPLVLCPAGGPEGMRVALDMLQDGRLGALVVTDDRTAHPDLVEVARTGRVVIAVGADLVPSAPGIVQSTVSRAPETVLGVLGVRG